MKLTTATDRTIEVNRTDDHRIHILIAGPQGTHLPMGIRLDRAEARALIAALETLTRLLREG